MGGALTFGVNELGGTRLFKQVDDLGVEGAMIVIRLVPNPFMQAARKSSH